MRRFFSISFVLAAALALMATGGAAARQAGAASSSEILWDSWGVPHIFAPDLASATYAFGQAQMQSHGHLVLRLYGQARGRAAEYWGPDYVEADRYVRLMGIPARAAQWWAGQTPAIRPDIEAFVAGINDYARAHPDQLAADVRAVLPVTPADVMAHVQRVHEAPPHCRCLFRNLPVCDALHFATTSGVPVTTTRPPAWPPSGPRSMT